MKKSLLIVFLFLSLLFSIRTFCQKGINYLEMKPDVNTLSCCRFSTDILNATLYKLYNLRNSKIEKGYAEYCYDCGTSLSFYGIIYRNNIALLISNEYLYRCIKNTSKLKGDAYEFLALNYNFLKDCEKAKESIKLNMKYQPKEYWNNDLIDIVNERCK